MLVQLEEKQIDLMECMRIEDAETKTLCRKFLYADPKVTGEDLDKIQEIIDNLRKGVVSGVEVKFRKKKLWQSSYR